MKTEFTPSEELVVLVALSAAIDREMSFQTNCPELVSDWDRDHLERLRSAYNKLRY